MLLKNCSIGVLGLVFVIGLVLVVVPSNAGSLKCKRAHQKLDECGSACPATCEDRHPMCESKCVRGCVCKPGFIFANSSKKKCIAIQKCPDFDECPGKNQVRDNCAPPPSCAPSCQSPTDSCSGKCAPGCRCKDGYLFNDDHECIPAADCDISDSSVDGKRCSGQNEEYNVCATDCPATCSDRSPFCVQECKPDCFCVDGFVRNEKNECVAPSDCGRHSTRRHRPPAGAHKCTGENEEYSKCAPPHGCAPRCDENAPPCMQQCRPGCKCTDGYERDESGNCILTTQCPVFTACNEHEDYSTCGDDDCEPTCESRTINCVTCKPGCACEVGFVKHNGTCIPEDECPVGDTNSMEISCAQADEISIATGAFDSFFALFYQVVGLL